MAATTEEEALNTTGGAPEADVLHQGAWSAAEEVLENDWLLLRLFELVLESAGDYNNMNERMNLSHVNQQWRRVMKEGVRVLVVDGSVAYHLTDARMTEILTWRGRIRTLKRTAHP